RACRRASRARERTLVLPERDRRRRCRRRAKRGPAACGAEPCALLPEMSAESTPLLAPRASVPTARRKAITFRGFCPQQVKLGSEQTGLAVRQQLHPPGGRGRPRLRPVQAGRDAL